MSFEYFFSPPREWCERKLSENYKYLHLFDKKEIIPSSNIFYGASFNGTYPGARMCERVLWSIDQSVFFPIGYICFKCSGFFKHDKEYGVLLLGNQRVDAERMHGNIVRVKLNNKEIGCFEWTFWSRICYKGTGSFYNKNNSVSGKIFTPTFFAGSNFHVINGMSNNTLWGNVLVNNVNCKYQIQQDVGNYKENRTYGQNNLWNLEPLKVVEPIDNEILQLNIDFETRLLLLYLFSRSIAFYTPERISTR